MLPETPGPGTVTQPQPKGSLPPRPRPQSPRATHLAEEVLPVDAGCGVALQLHLGRGRLQRLCLRDAGDFVVGAFNPVAPKLGQQDEGERPFSPQDLKGDSVESHPHYIPPGTPGQLPNSDLGTTQRLHGSQTTRSPKSHSQRLGVGTGRARSRTLAERLKCLAQRPWVQMRSEVFGL